MKLIIVRHGETYENLNGITQGQINSQLTEKGIEQAKKIAERLKDINIDYAYSSELDRCSNTCKEILKYHPKTKLTFTKILREQAKGIFEGKKKSNRDIMLKEKNIPYHKWRPEGGESLLDVRKKLVSFLLDLKNNHKNHTILIVSHGGPISCLISMIKNKAAEECGNYFAKENTSVSIIKFEKDRPIFEALNCSKHLE